MLRLIEQIKFYYSFLFFVHLKKKTAMCKSYTFAQFLTKRLKNYKIRTSKWYQIAALSSSTSAINGIMRRQKPHIYTLNESAHISFYYVLTIVSIIGFSDGLQNTDYV